MTHLPETHTRPGSDGCLRWTWLAALLVLALAACQSQLAPTAVALAPSNAPKQLATVYMSPTPDAAEQQATRLAARPTLAPAAATATATPTVYVGVFLGEAASLDDVSGMAAVALQATSAQPPAPPDRLSTCPLPPDERFGTNWRAATSLVSSIGCPADVAVPYSGMAQIFERGAMYLTPDGELWAVTTASSQGEGRFWYAAGRPETSGEPGSPPAGLRAPSPALLPYWQALPELRDAIGWARAEGQRADFTVQLFQNGTLLLDNSAGQVFILMTAGDRGPAYGPY